MPSRAERAEASARKKADEAERKQRKGKVVRYTADLAREIDVQFLLDNEVVVGHYRLVSWVVPPSSAQMSIEEEAEGSAA